MGKDEISALRRDAHSLKGASGCVAATSLHKALYGLQLGADALLSGSSPEQPLHVLVEHAEAEIVRTCMRVIELVPSAKIPAEAAKGNAERIMEIFKGQRRLEDCMAADAIS